MKSFHENKIGGGNITVNFNGKEYKSVPYKVNSLCGDYGCDKCDLAEKDSIGCNHPDECGNEYFIEVKQVESS